MHNTHYNYARELLSIKRLSFFKGNHVFTRYLNNAHLVRLAGFVVNYRDVVVTDVALLLVELWVGFPEDGEKHRKRNLIVLQNIRHL